MYNENRRLKRDRPPGAALQRGGWWGERWRPPGIPGTFPGSKARSSEAASSSPGASLPAWEQSLDEPGETARRAGGRWSDPPLSLLGSGLAKRASSGEKSPSVFSPPPRAPSAAAPPSRPREAGSGQGAPRFIPPQPPRSRSLTARPARPCLVAFPPTCRRPSICGCLRPQPHANSGEGRTWAGRGRAAAAPRPPPRRPPAPAPRSRPPASTAPSRRRGPRALLRPPTRRPSEQLPSRAGRGGGTGRPAQPLRPLEARPGPSPASGRRDPRWGWGCSPPSSFQGRTSTAPRTLGELPPFPGTKSKRCWSFSKVGTK